MVLNVKPRESALEKYLIARVKDRGGKGCKFSVPGEAGHPDRLVKLPGQPAFLIELKRKGGLLAPLQRWRAYEWIRVGMEWRWASSKADVDLALSVPRFE